MNDDQYLKDFSDHLTTMDEKETITISNICLDEKKINSKVLRAYKFYRLRKTKKILDNQNIQKGFVKQLLFIANGKKKQKEWTAFRFDPTMHPIDLGALNNNQYIRYMSTKKRSNITRSKLRVIAGDPGMKDFLVLVDGWGNKYIIGHGLGAKVKHLLNKYSLLQKALARLNNDVLTINSGDISIPEKNNRLKATLSTFEKDHGLRDASNEESETRKTYIVQYLNSEMKEYQLRISNIKEKNETIGTSFLRAFDIVVLPRMNVKEMLQGKGLSHESKAILGRLSHLSFFDKLKFQMSKYKRSLVQVSEAYSTITCSCCFRITRVGFKRIFTCSNKNCKNVMGRDENAARNILYFALLRIYQNFPTRTTFPLIDNKDEFFKKFRNKTKAPPQVPIPSAETFVTR